MTQILSPVSGLGPAVVAELERQLGIVEQKMFALADQKDAISEEIENRKIRRKEILAQLGRRA